MLAAAAAAATASGVDALLSSSGAASHSVSERLGVAVIGARGRGNSHLGFFSARRDTRVLYVCDVDSQVGRRRAAQVARRQGGSAPQWVEDLRRVLEDPRVDIVSIATPNHWHALSAIWAMQAGKDVYVEMPVSHNVREGRSMVAAARRYQRICQSGLQARSNPGMMAAIEFVRRGGIGQVSQARGLCYERPRTWRASRSCPIPHHINYGLWLGPAPAAPLTRQRFHYDWRWQWPYGSSLLGNQSVHQLDICRWGLQLPAVAELALSFGGRCEHPQSIGNVDTQWNLHVSGDKSIVTEVRQRDIQQLRNAHVGVIFEGTEGYVVMASYHSGTAFDRAGKPVRHFRGGGGGAPHFENFLHAVRARSCLHANGDIEQGHVSSALAHVANISLRLGHDVSAQTAREQLVRNGTPDGLLAVWDLAMRDVATHKSGDAGVDTIRMGQPLQCNPDTECVRDNQLANCLLTRQYRHPYVVPATGRV